MHRRRTAALAIAVALAALALPLAAEQIRLPRLPRSIPKELPRLDRLPSLDDLLGRQPLTSSLDDAVTEVAFLDRFNPGSGSPLLELPMGLDDGVTLVPGLWDAHVQSYCLKAGTFGPTRGDGYLWAPFKGPKADVVNAVLTKSAYYRDLPQQDVQVLLWGIIARTRVSQMGEGAQRAAQRLLDESQIASIDGSALDVIPDQWIRKITGPLDGIVRRALEAENRLRQLFANPGAVAYQELERIAVLNGVPPLSERGREVPAGRWSFHPNGYFIRFLPNSYTNMQLQIYVPERFTPTRAGDRLTAIVDAARSELQVVYGAGGGIESATYRAAGGSPRPVSIRTGAAIANAAREAAQDAARFVGGGRQQSPRARDVQDVALLAASIDDPEAAAFLSRAWASAVGDWAREGASQANGVPADPRYLEASAHGGLFARPWDAAWVEQRGGGWGGGGGGGSGGGGGGGGGMPGGGRQRLGPSLRKFGDDNSIDRARNAIDKFNSAKQVMDLGDPAGIFGFGIPDALFGKILDFNFDAWGSASSALAGDPPRDDFREFTRPQIGAVPQLKAGPALSAARAERLNGLARDLAAVNAHLQAAIVALDRHGGAVRANERSWASRQAQALTYLKREAGVLTLKVAAHLDALGEGAADLPPLGSEQIEARRRRLAAGWTDVDRQAAAAAGFDDEALEKLIAARRDALDAQLGKQPGSALKDAAEAMRELGSHFASLPAIDPPWDTP